MKVIGCLLICGLLIVFGIPLAFTQWEANMKRSRESYYERHPLLKSIHAASMNPDGSTSTHTPRATETLLARIALGTPQEKVLSILREEDLQCGLGASGSAPRQITCNVSKAAREHYVPNWNLILTPDHSGRLAHADVWMGK